MCANCVARRFLLQSDWKLEAGSWKLEAGMLESLELPGPADVEYFTRAQAGGWGETLRGFLKFLALPPGWRVLDVGTGPGLLPRLLADAGARLAVGCDDSPAMLRRAAALARPDRSPQTCQVWAVSDALHPPFTDAAFDAAVATNLLFLLPDPAAGIAALARVVRPGGIVAFANPTGAMSVASASAFANARGLQGFDRFSFVNYGRLAEEYHRLSPGQWVALAETTGLADVRAETRAGGLVVFVQGVRWIGESANGEW
jgi:SAM-dependent methyltransferase